VNESAEGERGVCTCAWSSFEGSFFTVCFGEYLDGPLCVVTRHPLLLAL
jgi:hypothetical protein